MFMRIWLGHVHTFNENNEEQCQKHINLPSNIYFFNLKCDPDMLGNLVIFTSKIFV